MHTLSLVTVVCAALCFAGANGFHDAAHSVATSLATRTLTPRVALPMAAFMNLAGAFLGSGVADTISQELIAPGAGSRGMTVLFAALLGALAWNVAAWRLRLPTSATHALVGGLLGAAVAGAGTVYWDGVLAKVIVPMLVAPAASLLLGFLAMVATLWSCRRATPQRAQRGFRMAQTVSAAGIALGHGIQDAQKTMGVVAMALVVADVQTEGDAIPLWVRAASALALALGTYAGGWCVVRSLRRRLIQLDAPRGFAAETASASVLYAASYLFSAPVSATYVLASASSAAVGVGAPRRLRAINWRLAKCLATGWLLALPTAAATAATIYALLRLATG